MSPSKAVGDLPTLPTSRTKVCVADFNGDERLDLLVGDMQRQMVKTRELSEEEKAADEALKEKQMPLLEQYKELLKGPKDESEEAKTERRKKFTDVCGQLRKIQSERAKYYNRRMEIHGWVWLLVRTAG